RYYALGVGYFRLGFACPEPFFIGLRTYEWLAAGVMDPGSLSELFELVKHAARHTACGAPGINGERGTMQFLSPSLVDRCDPQEIAVCAVVNRATNDNYLGLITRLIQSGSAGNLRATSRATACFESFGFFFQISSAIFCH